MRRYFDKALSALYKGNVKEFKYNLERLEDVNYVDRDGRSLVFYSILQNNIEFLKILLNNKAEINLKDNQGWAPLHYSANEYFTSICELLINEGADVNARDSYGNTVIWRAVFASKGRGEIISLLLQNGADPLLKNDTGISALDLANTIANYDINQFFTDYKS